MVTLWAEIDQVCYFANGIKAQLLFAGQAAILRQNNDGMDILLMDSNENWYNAVGFVQNKVFTKLSFS